MVFYPLFMLLLLTVFTACSGGGAGSTSSSGAAVSGVASKGPISNGTVRIYAVDPTSGTRGALLQTTQTDQYGNYSANVAATGNVIVEVVGGTYTDEATSTPNVPNPGLRAVVPNVSGTVKAAVTPLTEVAFKMMSSASGKFSATNATRCNGAVSTAFGVDIIGTQPVDASDATKVANSHDTAAIDYAVALAAISKMVQNGDAANVMDAVGKIQNDLSTSTPKLTTTGTALANAVTQMVNSGKLAPSITANSISVGSTISFFTDNTVNPPTNPDGVVQAKGLIHDLRNTVLSVVDYQTGNVADAIKTPFHSTAQELQTTVAPELTSAGDLIGWVVNSAGTIPNLTAGTTYTITDPMQHPGETLTIQTAATGYSATVTIATATTTLLSGTMSIDDINVPTSGSLSFTTIKTVSGNSTLSATFSGVISGNIYTSLTLKGKMTTPVATFDFSDTAPGGKLSATFAPVPGTTDSVELTSLSFKGVASTATARVTGVIDVPTLVRNTTLSTVMTVPGSANISGTIEGFSNSTTVLTITGSLSGTFSNAATYNPHAVQSSSNFPNVSATFNGSIVASTGLNVSALLKASMPQYQVVNFEAKYTRTLPDGTTIFLGGTGTYDASTQVWTAVLTNQNGMKVALSYDATLSRDQRFSGTIKTSGGIAVANFSMISGVPRVSYADNYFETIM